MVVICNLTKKRKIKKINKESSYEKNHEYILFKLTYLLVGLEMHKMCSKKK